jgi:predicted AAA+ superfamily ATPase
MVKYYPRKLEADVEKWIRRDKSVIIVGPRQAGKTTLLKHLSEKHGWPYYTLDDTEILETLRNVKEFAKIYGNDIIIIDEGQYDPEIGRKLKYLHDVEEIRVIASGSGSFDIKVKVTGELVGRAARLELLPLSFDEFVEWKAEKRIYETYTECRNATYKILRGEDDEPPVKNIPALETLWKEYVVFGGYPEVVLEENTKNKEEKIQQIISAYIDRDIVGLLGVRNYEKFRKTTEYLARIVGTPLKIASLTQSAGTSYQTATAYLALLSATYVVFSVEPYPISAGTLRKASKYYFYDVGVRNEITNDFRPFDIRQDSGAILENFVARHLKQEFGKVHYYRTKAGGEVDFIVGDLPIEVKISGKATRILKNVEKKLDAPYSVIVGPYQFSRGETTYHIPAWFL